MNESQQALVAEVAAYHEGEIGTHSATCYLRHAGCLARLLSRLDGSHDDI